MSATVVARLVTPRSSTTRVVVQSLVPRNDSAPPLPPGSPSTFSCSPAATWRSGGVARKAGPSTGLESLSVLSSRAPKAKQRQRLGLLRHRQPPAPAPPQPLPLQPQPLPPSHRPPQRRRPPRRRPRRRRARRHRKTKRSGLFRNPRPPRPPPPPLPLRLPVRRRTPRRRPQRNPPKVVAGLPEAARLQPRGRPPAKAAPVRNPVLAWRRPPALWSADPGVSSRLRRR